MDPAAVPDSAYLAIFSHLTAKQLLIVSRVCGRWHRVALDPHLWKRRLAIDFGPLKGDAGTGTDWLGEYDRLMDSSPSLPALALTGADRVQHLCFSRDGGRLVACSRDGWLKVWSAGGHWPVLHHADLKQLLNWRETVRCAFNRTGRLLLVSGATAGHPTGELAVFEFVSKDDQCEMVFRCRALNQPMEVYGCWLDDQCVLNGQSRPFNQTAAVSDLYFLHAASEQTTSTRLFQFYNATGGILRSVTVSHLPDNQDKLLIFTTGHRPHTPHQIATKLIKNERVVGPLQAAANCQKMRTETRAAAQTVQAAQAGQTVQEEKEKKVEREGPVQTSDAAKKAEPVVEEKTKRAVVESSSSSSEDESGEQGQPGIRVHTFDRTDRVMETNGRVLGLALSPDQRFLFIHHRPFLINSDHNQPDPVPVQDRLRITALDLTTFSMLDDCLTVNSAQHSTGPVDVDANEQYVLSGGEEGCAYLWDRRRSCLVRSLTHQSGRTVRAVALHPTDSHVCVSAAEDGALVVWRSTARARAQRESDCGDMVS